MPILGLGNTSTKGGLSPKSIVKDNLKAYYRFKDTGELDYISDGCCYFDGTDDGIIISDHSSLDITDAITLSVWVYPLLGSKNQGLFYKGDLSGSHGPYQMWLTNAAIPKVKVNIGTGTTTTSTSELSLNNWHHVVLTYNKDAGGSDEGKIYINGVHDKDINYSTAMTTDSNNLHLGQYHTDNTNEFQGYMCNAAIWSRALSSAEINSIMYKQYADLTSSESTSLVSWWPLQGNANDSVGTNNGTDDGTSYINSSTLLSTHDKSFPINYERIVNTAPSSSSTNSEGEPQTGQALYLDGVGDWSSSYNSSETNNNSVSSYLGDQSKLTIACWIQFPAAPNYSYSGFFFITGGAYNHQDVSIGFTTQSADSKLYFACNKNNGGQRTKNVIGFTPTINKWYRVVGVVDVSTLSMNYYVNGVSVGTHSFVLDDDTPWSTSDTINFTSENTYVFLGTSPDLPSLMDNYANAYITDAQLWVSNWSADDVEYDFRNREALASSRSGTSLTTSDLKLWYPLNTTSSSKNQHQLYNAIGTKLGSRFNLNTTFYGSEELDDPNCADASAWTDGTSPSYHTVTSNEIQIDDDGSQTVSSDITEASPFTAVLYTTYRFSCNITDRTAGGIHFKIGGSSSSTNLGTATLNGDGFYVTNGTAILDITVTSNTNGIQIRTHGSDGFVGNLDSLSVKKVGIADGWSTVDQQSIIPQNILMKGSQMLLFDKTSGTAGTFVDLGNLTYLANVTTFTVSLWCKLENTSVTDALFGKGEGANDNITIKQYSNRIWFGVESSENGGNGTYLLSPSSSYPDKEWHMVTCVYNGGGADNAAKQKIYIDGVEPSGSTLDAGTFGTATDNNSTSAKIGRTLTNERCMGVITEVSVFSTNLSDAEVSELYNSGDPLDATTHSESSNLQGYWRNNVLTSDGEWEDLSTNNNHGTIDTTAASDNHMFLREGITSGKDILGFDNNLIPPGGGAAFFNGETDYIDLGETIALAGELSKIWWFKTDDVVAGGPMFGGGTIDDYDVIFLDSATNDLRLTLNNAGEYLSLDGSTNFNVQTWYHIVITRNDSNTITMYVNADAQSDTESSTNTFKVRYIGSDNPSGNTADFFSGWIDEVAIYGDALTAAEVTKNYNAGKGSHKN